MGPCQPALKSEVGVAVVGIKEWSVELMDVGLKERRVSFRVQRHMYVSCMDRLGTARRASAFHRQSLYTSSKHLVHPPYLTRAVAAFVNSDGCLEDGDGRGPWWREWGWPL